MKADTPITFSVSISPLSIDRSWGLLVALYLGGILAANAMAAKLFVIFGVHVTSGALAIPLVYLTTDLINELYGAPSTRLVVWMGFIANAVLLLMSLLCTWVPASPYGAQQAQFESIFHITPRVVVGSQVAYLISSMLDVWIFATLRRLTKEKHFWLSKNGSTVVSQFVDTCTFIVIAFAGTMPWRIIPAMVAGQYLVKIAAAPLGTPLSYAVLAIARKKS